MLITFDLDGTLIDSAEDLATAVNAMLAHLDRRPLSPEVVQSYVGNGAGVLVKRALGEGVTTETFEKGLAFFLEYYRAHALAHTRLYPGIGGLLEDLRSMDHTLAVLSNKPVQISQDILQSLKVAGHFFRIYGGDSFPTKKPDPAGLLMLLSESVTEPSSAIMIGDSPVDVQTAHNAGVRCCGVMWGFQPYMLQAAGADVLISKPHQLMPYL